MALTIKLIIPFFSMHLMHSNEKNDFSSHYAKAKTVSSRSQQATAMVDRDRPTT